MSISDDGAFLAEDVEKIIVTAIEGEIKGKSHQESKIGQWVDSVCANVIQELSALSKPFKYTVNCVMMQKVGAGLHTTSSCYWDCRSDGTVTVRWPEDRSKGGEDGVCCITTVFATAI